jgi:hypothetical protein
MKILAILLIILFMAFEQTLSRNKFAVTQYPTPVLNTPDFAGVFGGSDGLTLKTDNEGLIRELEFIAFKGTVFEIIDEVYSAIGGMDYKIYNVKTDVYNYDSSLYIDSRFVKIVDEKPLNEPKKLPSKKKIYEFLDRAIGYKYCWGGNYVSGINKMLEFYKPAGTISEEVKYKWTLRGCDCSGLMYEATNGYTERNTSKLVYSGEPVEIEGLTAEEICSKLKPLDMIVWNGHVIYVYDEHTAIQSSLSKGGVVKTDLLETIKNVIKNRIPVNDYDSIKKDRFVVRRWFPQ